MRVLCVIAAMGPGGGERAMARLVTALADRHQVAVLSWEPPEVAPFYPFPPSVLYLRTGMLGGSGLERVRRMIGRLTSVRRQVRAFRPNLVLSFIDLTNVTAVLACLGTGVPVVVAERTDPSHHYIPPFKAAVRTAVYGLAARIVVQTERVRRCFPAWLHSRIAIVPNAAPPPPVAARPGEPGPDGRFRVVGLGRLGPEKGFDRLIAAFGQIAGRHPLWDMAIFGEGGERAALEARIATLDLTGRVHLPGLTRTPEAELAASHLMAFPSHYEGFPNALAEGIATGLPAVAFTGVSGVEDLIMPGRTGLLADPGQDMAGLAEALDRLMGDNAGRAAMGAAAREHARNWAPETVHRTWEAVLASVIRDGGRSTQQGGIGSCAD